MQPYLTPERLQTMRAGRGLRTGYTTLDLVDLIADASAIADAYCNMAMTPVPGSLRGGVVVGEEHTWHYPDSHFAPGQRRLYLFQNPVVSVEGFRLYVGAGASADIPTETLIINHTERWIEVTSLSIASNSGLFGVTGWIVPIGGLANPMAQVDYTYGRAISEISERIYPIDDEAGQLVYQAAHGFWTDATVTVRDDGVEVDSGDYTLDREIGRVTFGAPVTGPVTLSYTHTMDRDVPTAVAMIATHLAGTEKNRSRGMTGGITKVKVGEISLDRGMKPGEAAHWLEQAVPEAAQLLAGSRVFWMA